MLVRAGAAATPLRGRLDRARLGEAELRGWRLLLADGRPMSGIRRSVGSAGGLPGWRGRCSPLRFASRIDVAQWRVSGLGDRGCVRAIAAR